MPDSAGFTDKAFLLSKVSSLLQVTRPNVASGRIASFALRAEIIHGALTGRREAPAASQFRKELDVESGTDSRSRGDIHRVDGQ
jgi:hypothetical protein